MLPKGLVLLISIGFATGVINLSKKNVLVRRLHSLENLARCDVLCLDKTGTLTEGKLTVEKVFNLTDEGEFNRLMSTYLNNTHDNNSTFTALKNHFNIENPYSTTASVPFYSDRKYSAVTLENGEIFVIGAPEKAFRGGSGKHQRIYDMRKARYTYGTLPRRNSAGKHIGHRVHCNFRQSQEKRSGNA